MADRRETARRLRHDLLADGQAPFSIDVVSSSPDRHCGSDGASGRST